MVSEDLVAKVIEGVGRDDIIWVGVYLASGGEVNICDQWGVTPLMVACNYGYYEMELLLLKYGADVNAVDNMDFSVLDCAYRTGDVNIIWALVNTGRLKEGYEGIILELACLGGYLDIVKKVLEEGEIDLNKRIDSLGFTVLMKACRNGYFEIVKILLEKGADVDIKNFFGNTAFDIAKMQEIKELILSKKQFFIGKYERSLDF